MKSRNDTGLISLSPENQQKWLSNPLFVLGYPKSGTSLLMGIFDNHPQLIVIPEETDFFNVVYARAKMLSTDSRISKKEKIKTIREVIRNKTHLRNFGRGEVKQDISGNFDYKNFDNKRFLLAIEEYLENKEFTPRQVLKAIPYAFRLVSDMYYSNVRYWVEKTPYNRALVSRRVDLIQEMFVQNKMIHIIRDPRDNYLAYKKKWPNLKVTDFCYEWKRVYTLIKKLENKPNNLTIRYEDLVTYPNKILQLITGFLHVQYSENLEMPSKYGNSWFGNSMFNEKHQGISNKNLGRFRDLEDQSEIAAIESMLQKPMVDMGYTPECTPTGSFLSAKHYLAYKANLIPKVYASFRYTFDPKLKAFLWKKKDIKKIAR